MEPQRPRRRCSLARVLVGVVIFALVAFVATHGWLQSLQDVEREVELLDAHLTLLDVHSPCGAFAQAPTEEEEHLGGQEERTDASQKLLKVF